MKLSEISGLTKAMVGEGDPVMKDGSPARIAYGPSRKSAGPVRRLIIGRLRPTPSMTEDLPASSNRPTFCCFCRKDISIVPPDEQLNYSDLGGILAPICGRCAENGTWKEVGDADVD